MDGDLIIIVWMLVMFTIAIIIYKAASSDSFASSGFSESYPKRSEQKQDTFKRFKLKKTTRLDGSVYYTVEYWQNNKYNPYKTTFKSYKEAKNAIDQMRNNYNRSHIMSEEYIDY